MVTVPRYQNPTIKTLLMTSLNNVLLKKLATRKVSNSDSFSVVTKFLT